MRFLRFFYILFALISLYDFVSTFFYHTEIYKILGIEVSLLGYRIFKLGLFFAFLAFSISAIKNKNKAK
jgi:hypothetical protein